MLRLDIWRNFRLRLVIETLEETIATDPGRKCWRMIDQVLVERTVKDVLPVLKETLASVRLSCGALLHI
jgi:prefoldin subunit 2